jgi:hypothetical protein
VTDVKPNSPMEYILFPGDKLVAVDNVSVENLDCAEITGFIASRAKHERKLTVISNTRASS